MKEITVRQFASVKRSAMNVAPLVVKKQKIAAKIVALGDELKSLNAQIEGWEGAIMNLTGGHTSEDLVHRVVIPQFNEDGTPKVDEKGNQIKITRYEPTSLLAYDEDKKCYVINEVETPVDSMSEEELTNENSNEE